jgi:hypothetical protein
MIIFQVTVAGRQTRPSQPAEGMFKQPILLYPAVLTEYGTKAEERISLAGKFELANPIPVDHGGKRIGLNTATYNVHCKLDKMGRPTDVRQELSLYADNPKEQGRPNLKITLKSSQEGSKFDAEYAPEGTVNMRLVGGDMTQPSIAGVQSRMPDMAKAIADSLKLKEMPQWAAGQEAKVTGLLSAKGTNLTRLIPELKDELRYIELADVPLRKNK